MGCDDHVDHPIPFYDVDGTDGEVGCKHLDILTTCGEMTVTLEDVYRILRLLVRGETVRF